MMKEFKDIQNKTNDKLDDKIKKNKMSTWDDLLKAKEDLGQRIETVDCNHQEFVEAINVKINEMKISLKTEIETLSNDTDLNLR